MLRKILLGTFFLSFNCAFAEPTSVLDRNYTLVDAGKNFLDAISYFPNFLLILACAIGVIFFVHAGFMLIKYGRNHQIKGSSITTRLIVSALLWSIPLLIMWVGGPIFTSDGNNKWFKTAVEKSVKPASRTAIDRCVKGNQCEQY